VAADSVTVRLRASGGRGTRRELDKTAKSTAEIGKAAEGASRDANLFTRALTLLGTRMGMIIILGGLMTVALGPGLLASVLLLTAGIAALGGVALGVFGVGAAVALRWAETVKSAGSAAWGLNEGFKEFKKTFNKAMAGGADKILDALADALRMFTPVLKTLTPAMNALADSIAFVIRTVSSDLAYLAPQLVTLFLAAAPLIEQAGSLIGPLAQALILLGTAGIPVLQKLMDWVMQFALWLAPAIAAVISWEQETGTLWKTLQVTAGVIAGVAGVVFDLGRIFYELYLQTQDLWAFLGSALLTAFKEVGKAIDGVSKNMDLWGPIIVTTTAVLATFYAGLRLLAIIQTITRFIKLAVLAFRMWRAGVTAAALAQVLFNTALLANPIGLVIIALVALVAGVVAAYYKFDWFRNLVNSVWQALKDAYHWIVDNWTTIGPILSAAFSTALSTITPGIEFIVGKIQWMIDHLGTVITKVTDAGSAAKGAVDKVKGPSGIDIAKGILGGKADGGPIGQSGRYLVGERGPEVVHLPRGANVQSNGGGDTVVHATLVMPNGDVLARQTLRAARRKQSVS
jgi:phage-related protein